MLMARFKFEPETPILANIEDGQSAISAADNILRAWSRVMRHRVGPMSYSNCTLEAAMREGCLGPQSAKREPFHAVEETVESIIVNRTPLSWRIALCVEYLGRGTQDQKAKDLSWPRHQYRESVTCGRVWVFSQTFGRREFAHYYNGLA